MTRGPRVAPLGAAAAVVLLAVWAGAGVAQTQPPARPPDIFYVPTPQPVADRMLQLAGVGPGDVVYDLGSGDGRILVIAAQKYGARGVGIEIDPDLVARARAIAAEGGVADRVTFVEGDLLTADVSDATVVTLYLGTSLMREVEPRLRAALRPGARIVSHQYRFSRWLPDETDVVDGREIFLWRVAAPR